MITNYYKLIVALLFVTNVFGQNLPSYLPKDGLVGWWPFNGNANDESGNGNHGTVNGATLTNDRSGNVNSAYDFTKKDEYIEIDTKNGSFDNQNYTISLWLRSQQNSTSTSGGPNVNPSIISRLPSGGTSADNPYTNSHADNWVIYEMNGEIALSSYSGGMDGKSPNILGDYWINIIFIKEGQTVKTFRNGKLMTSATNSNTAFFKNYPLRIGRSQHTYWKDYYGQLDDISIYNRALSEAEIQSLYTGTPITQNLPYYLPKDGLVGWWPFNGNANDESGNGNHGTVNGATLTNDRNGKASSSFSFDGKKDFINCINNNLPINNNSRSFSIWFKLTPTLNYDDGYCLVSYGSSINYGSLNDIFIKLKDIEYNHHMIYSIYNSDFDLSQKWHNIIITYTNTKIDSINYFLDGIRLPNKFHDLIGNISKLNTEKTELLFGKSITYYASQFYFNGQLDDIAIYNRALSEAEIQALYTGTPLCTTPPTPKVNPTVSTCADNSISIEATGATGVETYNWYDVAEGGTPIATSQIIKTPVLNYGENKTYWVSITNSVCESTRARVDVVVKELPTVKKPENYFVIV